MFNFAVFLLFAVALASAFEEHEQQNVFEEHKICVGQADKELFGVGQDTSCTKYWHCYQEVGYLFDCGKGYEFNYMTNQCDSEEEVGCAARKNVPEQDPEAEQENSKPETEQDSEKEQEVEKEQDPEKEQEVETDQDSDITESDIKCPPRNKASERIFFASSKCSEFFICSNGSPIKMACPIKLWWNQEKHICDYPQLSGCSEKSSEAL